MPSSPISRPEATIAGMIGTKMFDSRRAMRCSGLSFFAAISAASALLDSLTPAALMNSACTLFTSPVPKITWI